MLPHCVSHCHFPGQWTWSAVFHMFTDLLGFLFLELPVHTHCSLLRWIVYLFVTALCTAFLYSSNCKPLSFIGVVNIFTSCSFISYFVFCVFFSPNICVCVFLFCFCKLKLPVISFKAWIRLVLECSSHLRHYKCFSKISSITFFLLLIFLTVVIWKGLITVPFHVKCKTLKTT